MEKPIAQIVGRQKLVDERLWRNLDQVLRVRQKCPIGANGAWQHDARIFGHFVGNQRQVERLLAGLYPGHQPAEIAHGQSVVVLHAEGSGIVEGTVADVRDNRQT